MLIPVSELNALRFEGSEERGVLARLERALELDLDIHMWHDRLILAWQNPRTFWGERDVLVRIRTSAEMLAVLEELRSHHLLHRTDRVLFLSLVRFKMSI